jgi:hypothetical protein
LSLFSRPSIALSLYLDVYRCCTYVRTDEAKEKEIKEEEEGRKQMKIRPFSRVSLFPLSVSLSHRLLSSARVSSLLFISPLSRKKKRTKKEKRKKKDERKQ